MFRFWKPTPWESFSSFFGCRCKTPKKARTSFQTRSWTCEVITILKWLRRTETSKHHVARWTLHASLAGVRPQWYMEFRLFGWCLVGCALVGSLNYSLRGMVFEAYFCPGRNECAILERATVAFEINVLKFYINREYNLNWLLFGMQIPNCCAHQLSLSHIVSTPNDHPFLKASDVETSDVEVPDAYDMRPERPRCQACWPLEELWEGKMMTGDR